MHFFHVDSREQQIADEAWPLGFAPFIRLGADGRRELESGRFGLLPRFATELAYGRKTYNARSETVHELASFKESWAKSWRCVVPVEVVYEQNYESGKAVRWAIRDADRTPLGIAGIYRQWTNKVDGELVWTFAMLTVNADGHPVYSRMNRPGDEKRMVLILDHGDYDRWLTCTPEEAKVFFKQWQGELVAEPAPLPPRQRRP
jgi:putative SOS response-associated peptidase YedK